jgi:hypothetical protein
MNFNRFTGILGLLSPEHVFCRFCFRARALVLARLSKEPSGLSQELVRNSASARDDWIYLGTGSVPLVCHEGEEGKPPCTCDFASDENPNKDRAREMLNAKEMTKKLQEPPKN